MLAHRTAQEKDAIINQCFRESIRHTSLSPHCWIALEQVQLKKKWLMTIITLPARANGDLHQKQMQYYGDLFIQCSLGSSTEQKSST